MVCGVIGLSPCWRDVGECSLCLSVHTIHLYRDQTAWPPWFWYFFSGLTLSVLRGECYLLLSLAYSTSKYALRFVVCSIGEDVHAAPRCRLISDLHTGPMRTLVAFFALLLAPLIGAFPLAPPSAMDAQNFTTEATAILRLSEVMTVTRSTII